jgi:hypothetical protein
MSHRSAPPDIIRRLASQLWPDETLVNVNIPGRSIDTITGVRVAHQGRRKNGLALEKRTDPDGRPYYSGRSHLPSPPLLRGSGLGEGEGAARAEPGRQTSARLATLTLSLSHARGRGNPGSPLRPLSRLRERVRVRGTRLTPISIDFTARGFLGDLREAFG